MSDELHSIIPIHSLNKGDKLVQPIRLVEMTEFKDGSYDYSRPHRHNYYEIFFFEKGKGEHDIDFTTFAIDTPCLHFVSPGQIHQVRREANSRGWVLLFTNEFYYLNLANRDILHETPFLNRNHPQPIINLDDQNREFVAGIVKQIAHELEENHSYRDDAIRSHLNLLLIVARRLFESARGGTTEETGDSRLTQELRKLIERNFHSMHAVSAYANALNVTPGHLNDVVKKVTGRTVSSMIQERILLEAKRLLAHSNHSIKEVAHALGFDDPSYFTRFFRERAGEAPGGFRESFRKEAE
ncbi:MAG: helix-turn-helix transcriptional regulator [Candidatus Kapaibacterium sp.]